MYDIAREYQKDNRVCQQRIGNFKLEGVGATPPDVMINNRSINLNNLIDTTPGGGLPRSGVGLPLPPETGSVLALATSVADNIAADSKK